MGTIIESRPYRSGDEDSIVKLYNLITGRNRTVRQHCWEWIDNPLGNPAIWVLEEKLTNEIVGHHGLIPIQFVCEGMKILAGKTENTIMHPKYLGTGIYIKFERKFVEEAGNRFDLLFTTQGTGVTFKMRRHFGYEVIGPYEWYIKILARGNSLNNIFSFIIRKKIQSSLKQKFLQMMSFAIAMLSLLIPTFHTTNNTVCIEHVDQEHYQTTLGLIGEFWDKNAVFFGITPHRTPDYLQWRLFDNPCVNHQLYLATLEGKICGYVVTKTNPIIGTGIVNIVDIIAEKNDANLMKEIINAMTPEFIKCNVGLVAFNTLQSSNSLNKAFSEAGFFASSKILNKLIKGYKDKQAKLLVKITNHQIDKNILHDKSAWYYTELFREGIY